jgi:hypothetical protein
MTEEPPAELVMPFLPVTSKGGPFDDHAYTAGYEMGLLDAHLNWAFSFGRETRVIRTANREQADLLAMRHGWRAAFYEQDDDEWVGVEFVRIDPTLDQP